MRLVLLALLTSAVALAAPTPARKPVIALLPATSADAELVPLGLLVEARAAELLEQTNRYSELHVKQAFSMAESENLAPSTLSDAKVAAHARQQLGADRVVTVTLTKGDKGLTLAGAVLDGKKTTPFTAALGSTWSDAVTKGSEAIAKAVLAPEKGALPKGPAQPESSSEDALKALGRCYASVIRQPMGIETPSILEPSELDAAIANCSKALEADPKLRFAEAVRALAEAIVGRDALAAKSLTALSDADDALEPFTLARFWMLTRFQSNEAGIAYLRDVAKKHPGELIALGYLAETLSSIGDHPKSLEAWTAYQTLAPASPFAQSRLSKELARLDRFDDAVAAAKKALELDPAGKEARLQLGSRQIDAGKLDDAIATLTPLATEADPRGEHLLRLGWALWLKGDSDKAATLFQQSLDRATSASEWRTRGRAFYNLALVEAKRGRKDAARVSLKASLQTGFKVRQVDALLTEVAREVERTEFQDAGKAPPAKVSLVPRESSLFPVDAFGEVDPKAKKPPPPEGLVLYRF